MAQERILSGGLHYFRVHPQQWAHRLEMLRAMGLNTVETYVPWNLHEPQQGTFDFTGFGDISGFLRLAASAGLNAIVRPGPYICAEWDNGGFPGWLTDRPGIRLRCSDPAYLAEVDRWFDTLIPLLAEHQVTRGGNIIMVQVENEYGSYGSDHAYLRHLADGLTARGIEVPLFTSDGPEDHMLTGGTLPGVPATANFGSDPAGAFATLRRHRPDDPLFCMEFWCGWFDHWGDAHSTRDAADAADALARILAAGASVNIYLAHGGTNFGTWAGANRDGELHDGTLRPTVTSYDYDAPIDERGAATEKFWRFREVLAEYGGSHAGSPLPEPPPPAPLLPAQRVPLTEHLPLTAALAAPTSMPATGPVSAAHPPSFTDLGLRQGLALYRAVLPGPRKSYPLVLDGLADRAHVFADGRHIGTLTPEQCTVELAVPGAACLLEILVESLGRVNYGPRAHEGKGIGSVRHERQFLHHFTAYGISLDNVAKLPWTGHAPALAGAPGWPVFYRGILDLAELDTAEQADAFLAFPGWGKGYVWVNDFCLGRYWSVGPQHALYLPWPLLRPGRNEIVVLELDGHRHSSTSPYLEIRTDPAHLPSSQ